MSEKDTDILDTTLKTQDEIHEVLLGLFYPWNGLQALRGHLESLRAAPYKNTWLWNFVLSFLPPYLVQLSENIVLLRRSKEAADQDRKERGIVHFLHWLEALSWIRKTSEGILAILSLESQIQVSLLCGIFLRRDLD